jgi:transposase
MSLATADLPSDPDALRAFALACQAELKAAELSVQRKRCSTTLRHVRLSQGGCCGTQSQGINSSMRF